MELQLILLEPHNTDHLKKLVALAKQTFLEAYSNGNTTHDMQLYIDTHFNDTILLKELNDPDSIFYLAVIDTHVTGYIKVNKGKSQTEPLGNNAMELERIYVLRQYQGKKIGALLLHKAIAIARAEKVDFLWLGVWAENKNAIAFYEKHRFVIYGTHQFTLGTDVQNDFMMKLML